MTKIGLLSDTHGFIPERVFELFKDVDEIWHAGDVGSLEVIDRLKKFKPLRAVYGNIDDHLIRLELTENLTFQVEDVTVSMTHIAGKPSKYSQNAFNLIQKTKPNLFVCGHSHILKVMRDEKLNNMIVFNPGAAGIHGMHKIKTVLRFQLHEKKVLNLEVIELGKRGKIDNNNEEMA